MLVELPNSDFQNRPVDSDAPSKSHIHLIACAVATRLTAIHTAKIMSLEYVMPIMIAGQRVTIER
jgi:hypothetical protein